MPKLVAVINIVAWFGFWTFGFIAIAADGFSDAQLVISTLLAAIGLMAGIAAYLQLARTAETSGYARKTKQLDAAVRNRAQQQGSI